MHPEQRPYREAEDMHTRNAAPRYNSFRGPPSERGSFKGDHRRMERAEPAHGKPEQRHGKRNEDREHGHQH
jgi:hypothetical protein